MGVTDHTVTWPTEKKEAPRIGGLPLYLLELGDGSFEELPAGTHRLTSRKVKSTDRVNLTVCRVVSFLIEPANFDDVPEICVQSFTIGGSPDLHDPNVSYFGSHKDILSGPPCRFPLFERQPILIVPNQACLSLVILGAVKLKASVILAMMEPGYWYRQT